MKSAAGRFAQWLVKNGASARDVDVLIYGCESLAGSLAICAAILIAGALQGNLLGAVCWIAFLIPVRSAAGGVHANSRLGCLALSISVGAACTGAARWIKLRPLILLIGAALSMTAVFLRAPVAHPDHPLGPVQKRRNRRRSVAAVLLEVVLIVTMCEARVPSRLCSSAFLGLGCATVSVLLAIPKK